MYLQKPYLFKSSYLLLILYLYEKESYFMFTKIKTKNSEIFQYLPFKASY